MMKAIGDALISLTLACPLLHMLNVVLIRGRNEMKMGMIDLTKVTRLAPSDATSVAGQTRTAGGIVGLSGPQARTRLIEYGKNRIQSAIRPRLWRQFLQRFYNPLSLLLLFACAIAAATGQVVSAAIVALMVVFGAALDVLLQRRAENAAERPQQSVALRATVLRDGREEEVDVQDIVPGDVVVLRAGQLVPADGRVLATNDFFVKQAVLTLSLIHI